MNASSPIVLSNANIPQLARTLPVPLYDRRRLRPGLVHVGVGEFNRSHLAVYLDDLLFGSSPADTVLCWASVADWYETRVRINEDIIDNFWTRIFSALYRRRVGKLSMLLCC